MKKTFFSISFAIVFLAHLSAQYQLVGISAGGGNNNTGTIYAVNDDGSNEAVYFSFDKVDGYNASGIPMIGSDGMVYATVSAGGEHNYGLIYKIGQDGTNYTVIHDFDGVGGASPFLGKLLEASDGRLYGVAGGGLNNVGVVYALDMNGTGYEVLHHFNDNDGNNPAWTLIEGSDGYLYGTTSQGGEYANGTIFKIQLDGTGFTVLHSFGSASDGNVPFGGVIEHPDGKLYGWTSSGGTDGAGVVFRIGKNGLGYEVMHQFSYSDGPAGTFGQPCLGSDGLLYGISFLDGNSYNGCIFSVNTLTLEVLVIKYFDGANGRLPLFNELIEASNGRLFGMTWQGGPNDAGVVFNLNKDGSDYVVSHYFNGATGVNPFGALEEAPDGSFFGTTNIGGILSRGNLFKLNMQGNFITNIYEFSAINNTGFGPTGGLKTLSDGKNYSVTRGGGIEDGGTIFKANKDGTGFQTIHHFSGFTGKFPSDNITEAINGKLFGTTTSGGASNRGVLFSMNKDGSNYTVHHNFDNNTEWNPVGELLQASDGKLYGMTSNIMPIGGGSIYSINQDGSGYEVVFSFANSESRFPYKGLIEMSDGFLYGTTQSSTINGSTAFKVRKDGTGFQLLHLFDNTDLTYPNCDLMAASNGKLYGTTSSSLSAQGKVFSLNTDGSGFEVIHQFLGTEGTSPTETLIEGPDNRIYGNTTRGGEYDKGVLFSLGLDGSNFQKHFDFGADAVGASLPNGNLLLNNLSPATEKHLQIDMKIVPNPTKDAVQLYINGLFDANEILTAKIMDANGKLVWQGKGQLYAINDGLTHIAAVWPSGIYLVEVKTQSVAATGTLVVTK